jgi:hypothetical protein
MTIEIDHGDFVSMLRRRRVWGNQGDGRLRLGLRLR